MAHHHFRHGGNNGEFSESDRSSGNGGFGGRGLRRFFEAANSCTDLFRHSSHGRRSRRSLRLSLESLEQRTYLSINSAPLSSATTHQMLWEGHTVTASTDRWIVHTTTPSASATIGVFSGWQSRSLGEGFYSLTAPGASTQDVLGWASRTGGVAYVEPDFLIRSTVLPNEPSFSSLWGLHNVGQSGGVTDVDIDAPEAWNTSTGSRSVVVAVIDTGIDFNHPDLAANAWKNPREVAGDNIDNDGNGYVDDVYGWDFSNSDSIPMDDNGHGTHVSGTIGAVGNNATGVVGVNWQVSIMGLKFLDADGSGSTSAAIAAINYATRMRRDFGINIVATNNSWGGGGFSASLRDAIEAGGRAGILFVAAAGNESNNNDLSPSYPASGSSDAIISVAATDRSNTLASFSNYGSTSVDLAAPGVSIYSTTPNSSYASYSGTSMATPHVTGTVALLAAAAPQATSAQIRAAILSSTTLVPGLAGKVATGGLLNVAAALQALGSSPPVVVPSLVADIVDVTPDPRTTAVDAVVIVFNLPVTGLTLADLRLVRSGIAVPLDGAQITSTDGVRWTLSGLASATLSTGVYTLSLNADSGRIIDATGRPLSASVSDSWTVNAASLVDAGDTLATAAAIPVNSGNVRLSGSIGDGGFGSRDVDLYRITLQAGQRFVVDIDARTLSGSSTLDSYVRVLDAFGRQLSKNDDFGNSYDSFLIYTARTSGTYYVGVSGYGNPAYNPNRAGSGRNGSTGVYQISLEFAAMPTGTSAGSIRMMGFRDSVTNELQRQTAFAVYGMNCMAAVSSTPSGSVRRR